MQPRVDFISLGVRSVAASRAFYVDGLGWSVHREVPGDVVFIQVNHGLVLSLWDVSQMQADAGVTASGGVPCITLSHNLPGTEDVDRVMEEAAAAGAEIVAEPITQPWGGYSGYFADPDGFRWEVAYNPTWAVDDDGAVTV
ncbi:MULTISPECIES: VOC family protein [Pseudarthrobacter]|uniref:Glyoxalase n=1 Tax=Pseudarthrobacter polychromogenes TaxID=1676 RepID=A0ABQ1XD44_9MICC|nr:VOC family protein [Pseudarthrobacter polychromogenes]MBD1536918.1 glyoxalase [Arthrobacter sp. S13_S34]MBD1592260.1 glyoxalase [Arthrobacter sp. S1_S22]GGG85118.1 glyoxalase [Pseudarthrobacter polychromogenes]